MLNRYVYVFIVNTIATGLLVVFGAPFFNKVVDAIVDYYKNPLSEFLFLSVALYFAGLTLNNFKSVSFNKSFKLLSYPPVWLPTPLFVMPTIYFCVDGATVQGLVSFLISDYYIVFLLSLLTACLILFHQLKKGANSSQVDSDVTEMPIMNECDDKLNYSNRATRIVQDINKSAISSVYVCGEFGTGKTSLINLIESKFDNKKHIFVKFESWGRNPKEISKQILESCVDELSSKIDCSSIFTVPSSYIGALKGSAGDLSKILFSSNGNPKDILSKMNKTLCEADLIMHLVIEDADRNLDRRIISEDIPALIDHFRLYNRIKVYVLLGNKYQSIKVYSRVCDWVEFL